MTKELESINSKICDSRSELSDLYELYSEATQGEENEIRELIEELEGDLFNAESTCEKLKSICSGY